ncbi:hypothetical protein E5S70_33845 [Ensifer adhaerens]|uniref:hypothetical protein n=1 Tax=Ensifer canadensis TaxID=555315 RepID=UPI00149013C7|nr:hypothetical protein [Ensifer canadensis]NOV20944.1 hypothetical protein [Ensifer canadensis]
MDTPEETAATLSDEEILEVFVTAIDNMLESERLTENMAAMLRAAFNEAQRRGLIVSALH